MRIGLVCELKSMFPHRDGDPDGLDSELLSDIEENALLSGLRDAGHEVIRIGDGAALLRQASKFKKQCDLVLNLSVGYRGLDRKSFAPGVLELAEIPYVGSGAYALSLTRNKYHSKLVVEAAGVPTGTSALWTGPESRPALDRVIYPAIVKPVAESSSIGIGHDSIVRDADEAASRASWVLERFQQHALVEEFINGTEVEVPLLGAPNLEAQGVVAITVDEAVVNGETFLSGDEVYDDRYGFLSPAPGVSEAAVLKAAEVAARALGIRDYGRIDFRVRPDGTPMFMEASTHPHIQPHSSFFHLAKMKGLDYPGMLDQLLQVGAKRLGVR